MEWDVYPAYVRNHHKSTYNNVGTLLERQKIPRQTRLKSSFFYRASWLKKLTTSGIKPERSNFTPPSTR